MVPAKAYELYSRIPKAIGKIEGYPTCSENLWSSSKSFITLSVGSINLWNCYLIFYKFVKYGALDSPYILAASDMNLEKKYIQLWRSTCPLLWWGLGKSSIPDVKEAP